MTMLVPPPQTRTIAKVNVAGKALPVDVDYSWFLYLTQGLFQRVGGANADIQFKAEKGAANGYASLGSGGRVPPSQLGSGTASAATYLRGDGTWQSVGAVGANGSTVVDFGAAPGSNIASAVVTGQTGILAGSLVNATLKAEATTDHNEYEHIIVPLQVIASDIVPGVGFTINAVSDLRLTGEFSVRWSWE